MPSASSIQKHISDASGDEVLDMVRSLDMPLYAADEALAELGPDERAALIEKVRAAPNVGHLDAYSAGLFNNFLRLTTSYNKITNARKVGTVLLPKENRPLETTSLKLHTKFSSGSMFSSDDSDLELAWGFPGFCLLDPSMVDEDEQGADDEVYATDFRLETVAASALMRKKSSLFSSLCAASRVRHTRAFCGCVLLAIFVLVLIVAVTDSWADPEPSNGGILASALGRGTVLWLIVAVGTCWVVVGLLPACYFDYIACCLQVIGCFRPCQGGSSAKVVPVLEYKDSLVVGDNDESSVVLDDEQSPVFFASRAEAAAHFHLLIRRMLPGVALTTPYVKALHADAELSALCFAGLGSWYLEGVNHDAEPDAQWKSKVFEADFRPQFTVSGWSDLNLPDKAFGMCVPPANARYVVDMSRFAVYDGRNIDGVPAYERLGAACFFDSDRRPIAIWLPLGTRASPAKQGRMVLLGSSSADGSAADEAAQATWIFKSTLLFRSFAVDHLTWCHWLMSNSLAYAAKATLGPSHPLRRLIKPFVYKTPHINHAAVVRLTGVGGAVERNSSYTSKEMSHAISLASTLFNFRTFEKHLEQKGLTEEELASIPLAADGRRLWVAIHTFWEEALAIIYPTEAALHEDKEACQFWALANGQEHRSGLRRRVSSSPLGTFDWCCCYGSMQAYQESEMRDPGEEGYDLLMPSVISRHALNRDQPRIGEDAEEAERSKARAALADYLTRSVFFSTAVHELLGNTIHYVTSASGIQPRVQRFDKMPQNQPPQGSVQDYMRSITVAGTTQLKMPQLIGTMRDMAAAWGSNAWRPRGGPKEMHVAMESVHTRFADALESVARVIESANRQRPVPFHMFNPEFLEVSVSL